MSPGSNTESYSAFAHIGLRENPGKNLNQVTCPNRESNPGHLVLQPDALTVTPQISLRNNTLTPPERNTVTIWKLNSHLTKPRTVRSALRHCKDYVSTKSTVTGSYYLKPRFVKYMIIFLDEYIVRNGNIKFVNLSFEKVEKFKYLGATVTNINDTRKEIKRRINMGNACYYSVEKLLSSSLPSKNSEN
ncbi:hypothetical protein ANN_00294 [Periplaneta americana]|uniref:Uncharacterized protein n=1 Tax=Periplaneta americana TaxID=6978 RepID=A0ABQ8TQI5_PERAM|nr:hypothetical protein ANN_00294 [Periplaneta americana]